MGSQTRSDHEITNLRTAAGELSFDARIGERTTNVWMRTDSPLTPNADAALAAAVMPAMRQGGRLRMTDPVSPRMLRGQREFQGVQRAWSLDWPFTEPLREVEVEVPLREVGAVVPKGRVAAFFSGGVDSWGTVLDNPDLTDLIFVRGFDLAHEGPQTALSDEVEGRLREAADELGLQLHVVTTNLRELSDPHLPWDVYFGCADVAVALFFAPLFDRVLIAGDSDYEVQVRFGANLLVDQLWSTEELEIVDDGGRFSRMQRLERLVESPAACRSLRVCWEIPDQTYNCGRCRKCLMTLIGLEAIGARERVTTFPPELNLDPTVLAEISIDHVVSLTLWEDILDAARGAERDDLERAVVPVIAKAKAGLGLPREYRRRHLPGPPPTGAAQSQTFFPADTAPALFATPETAAAIAEAGSLAFLVGGYDGSGNFGDVLMLDAALELLAPLEPGLVVLPVLERQFGSHHPELAEQMIRPPRHQVYFDPEGAGDDELVPIAPGPDLSSAISYFYGGGYFNGFWGDRKLAMMRAAEALLAKAGPAEIRRLGSGLQVEAAWLAGLSAEDVAYLRAFELLGTRDPRSGGLLTGFGSALVPESGDDAVGCLARLRPAEPPVEGPLLINLHFSEHDWVTDRAQPLLGFYVELLAELVALTGRPLVAQPLIAYLDPRVDERPATARLVTALSERGVEVREPIVLRPASLGAAAAEMDGASFTLACSYHAALTSLMLGLPTLTIAHNPFYEQKAAGLLDAFGQPAEFAIGPGGDPRACAELLVATALDPEAGTKLRVQLALDGRRMRRLRAATEADLYGRIAATAAGLEEDAPPRAAIGAEADRRVRSADDRARVAEERAWQSEARAAHAGLHASNLEARLAELMGSSSWRLTEPLRRLGKTVRRDG
ncbi:MAG TPA: polysaccharide pyruvyl transferase family protein [Solirubrobacterales bacterium]|nr:polysaccharide pyruvyl transferase family protein [Solirubrobacterales bacterium]